MSESAFRADAQTLVPSVMAQTLRRQRVRSGLYAQSLLLPADVAGSMKRPKSPGAEPPPQGRSGSTSKQPHQHSQ